MPKTIIIGLDGADWQLLNPWIEAGHLPTLAKLVSEGASGKLESTIRPESSVAWSSFSTGVNPGKHGVFGFAERVSGSYAFKLVNASSVKVKRFWHLLGEVGIKTNICHTPITYPPAPLNGSLITGMLTPSTEVMFTYPPELRKRILSCCSDYIFDVGNVVNDKARLVDRVYKLTEQQLETALMLLKDDWDFFTVVFTGTDRLQHFFWSDMDTHHPLHPSGTGEGFEDVLLKYYQLLDDAIAEILTQVPSDTLVFIISDHGFNGVARRFFINHWLSEHGYLSFKKTSNLWTGLLKISSWAKSVSLLRRLKQVLLPSPSDWNSMNLRAIAFTDAIDWTQTRAYFGLDGGVRINLKGREPEGIVNSGEEYDALRQELRQELLAVKEPGTIHTLLSEVYYREDLYSGLYVDTAPDLIVEPERASFDANSNWILDGSLQTNRKSVFDSSLPYSGNHKLDGILIAWGIGIKNIRVDNAKIIDLASTILAIFGVSKPEYMDGKVLSCLFAPNALPEIEHYPSTDAVSVNQTKNIAFDPEETKLIEDRLRNLGYLD